MNFHTRKWVKPEDLNPNGTLFGGSLLRWIDEEAAIYAICQLDNQRVVTKFMSEINFVSSQLVAPFKQARRSAVGQALGMGRNRGG
ncbi:acyl-CoA hydrolase [Paraburkholderia sp. WSM4179]|nr:acyl-CoA hydrolase [Paraburkholderia sp. WSM4179]